MDSLEKPPEQARQPVLIARGEEAVQAVTRAELNARFKAQDWKIAAALVLGQVVARIPAVSDVASAAAAYLPGGLF